MPTLSRQTAGFTQFELGPSVQRGIEAAGFTEPRPIQTMAIPAALAGRDILGLAQTGTGKTAAFALPIIERLQTGRQPVPRALIVVPTRELAMQVHAEFRLLAQFTRLRAVAIFGGVSAGQQIRGLRDWPDIVIACPGRLLDLYEQGHVSFRGIEILVLDEADHMFDLGFMPDVKRILSALPAQRQTMLFSATMPGPIRQFTDRVLTDPHVVELKHSTPAETIEHVWFNVNQDKKLDLLLHLLDGDDFESAIVFSRTKHRAKRLAQQLAKLGHDAAALQGNMSQAQRDQAMKGFRGGRYSVLVATDIAARGIDVANISHVINFDVPDTPDAYTHRIGRTGRAERTGKACTFVTRDDMGILRAIERHLEMRIPQVALPIFEPNTSASSPPSPTPTPAPDRNRNDRPMPRNDQQHRDHHGRREYRGPRDRHRDGNDDRDRDGNGDRRRESRRPDAEHSRPPRHDRPAPSSSSPVSSSPSRRPRSANGGHPHQADVPSYSPRSASKPRRSSGRPRRRD